MVVEPLLVARTRAIVAYSRSIQSDASTPRFRSNSFVKPVNPMTNVRTFAPGRSKVVTNEFLLGHDVTHFNEINETKLLEKKLEVKGKKLCFFV